MRYMQGMVMADATDDAALLRDRAPGGGARTGWYELFVLGELMDQPMHGYLLQRVLGLALGPYRQWSWGALYPLLRRLEQAGLIAHHAEGSTEVGRPRKAYRITDAGRRAFFERMLEPADYAGEASDLFWVKLENFGHLRPDQRMGILRHYRGYLEAMLSHLAASRAYVAEHSQIPDVERPWILRVIDHRTHLITAERDWIDIEIRRTESQRDD